MEEMRKDKGQNVIWFNSQKIYPRNNVLSVCVLVLLCALIFYPVVKHMFAGAGVDFITHNKLIDEMLHKKELLVSYFLYHGLVFGFFFLIKNISAFGLLPTSYLGDPSIISFSGFVVILIFYVFLSLIIYNEFRSLMGRRTSIKENFSIIVVTLSLMVVSPINLMSLSSHKLYLGYIGINVYHNPTMIVLKPFALLCFLNIGKLLELSFKDRSIGVIYKTGILTALSILAKPNFIICFLPAVGILILYKHFKNQPVAWRVLIFGFFLPSILLLAWQYFFTYNPNSFSIKGVFFAPLKVYSQYSSYLFSKFVMSIFFPLVIYCTYIKKAVYNTFLNLAWLTFFFGAFYSYFLAESGPRIWDGNFFWSGQVSLFILFFTTALFFLQQNIFLLFGERSKISLKRFWVGSVAYGIHLISGLFWYYTQLTSNPLKEWW